MNQDIFVVIEHIRGQVSDISYVMLAAARDITETSGGNVVGVLLGSGAEALANSLDAVINSNFELPPKLNEFYRKFIWDELQNPQPYSLLSLTQDTTYC